MMFKQATKELDDIYIGTRKNCNLFDLKSFRAHSAAGKSISDHECCSFRRFRKKPTLLFGIGVNV